jgi:hypothetical protein
MRSTKQVPRNIIQSERYVIRVTPEKIMIMTRNFRSSLYVINEKSGTCKTCWGNEKCSQKFGDRDSVGGIETCYGPGGAGFESQWG